MCNEFGDLELQLLLDQLFENVNEEIIEEANINVDQIGGPKKKNKRPRNILISGSGQSSHQGRMKVSKHGETLSRATNHNNYISIFRKDKDTIEYNGNLKNIDMTSSEYEFYKNLFIRNENIIQLIKNGKGKYDEYVDQAFISDKQRRISGLVVNRDQDGNAKIYDNNGNLLYEENIKGEKI